MALSPEARQSRLARRTWNSITCDDLEEWADAGSLKRGKAYFDEGRVESLAMTPDGALLAWVSGSERYAVQVAIAPAGESPRLASLCTCPVGYACKHAVAAVLAYLDAVASGKLVPLAKFNDPRLRVFGEDECADEMDEESAAEWEDGGKESRLSRLKVADPADLRALIEAKSHRELVDLVVALVSGLAEWLPSAKLDTESGSKIAQPSRRHPAKQD
jgi:uncharacterized Zn finger protein